MGNWQASIGLEAHVQLKTKTKLFTGISNEDAEAEAGTVVGPLCLGLPGTLPVVNQKAIELAVLAGAALNAKVAEFSRFDRKHYFYPDLPLGYQITQQAHPIIKQGLIEVVTDKESFKVRLIRAHLEADAGKLTHPPGVSASLLDLNRVGTPLLEIVSQPDIHSPAQAKAYAREIALRMRYAGVSDCDMFAGNLRFDANISVSKDPKKLGTRTELKNLNSFRNLERALGFELKRQLDLLAAGKKIVQETRGWNEAKQATFSQRSKEEAHDYRYMPDPDIPPIELTAAVIRKLTKALPPTPATIRQQLNKLGLASAIAETILDQPEAANLLIEVVKSRPVTIAKKLANWLAGEILRSVSSEEITWPQVVAAKGALILLAEATASGQLSSTQAKQMIGRAIKEPEAVKADLGLKTTQQISDQSALAELVERVFKTQPKAVTDARQDPKAIGFLIGQVMQLSRGKANPQAVAQLIKKRLG